MLGLAYGHLFRSGAGTARVLIGGVLAAVVASAVGMGLIFLVAGGSFAGITEEIRMSVDMTFDMYQRAGVLEQLASQGIDPAQLRTELLRLTQVLLPGVLVMGHLCGAGELAGFAQGPAAPAPAGAGTTVFPGMAVAMVYGVGSDRRVGSVAGE